MVGYGEKKNEERIKSARRYWVEYLTMDPDNRV